MVAALKKHYLVWAFALTALLSLMIAVAAPQSAFAEGDSAQDSATESSATDAASADNGVTAYDFYITGKRITSENAADVLGDGTVSYDANTNTLTFNGLNINSRDLTYAVRIEDDVTLVLKGKNVINCEVVALQIGIDRLSSETTITGSGSLECIATYNLADALEINVASTLKLDKNFQGSLSATGANPVEMRRGNLIVQGGRLNASANGVRSALHASLYCSHSNFEITGGSVVVTNSNIWLSGSTFHMSGGRIEVTSTEARPSIWGNCDRGTSPSILLERGVSIETPDHGYVWSSDDKQTSTICAAGQIAGPNFANAARHVVIHGNDNSTFKNWHSRLIL